MQEYRLCLFTAHFSIAIPSYDKDNVVSSIKDVELDAMKPEEVVRRDLFVKALQPGDRLITVKVDD